MERADVAIVGAGHGGAQAAVALRQNGFEGSIAVIGREPELPYERPPLSKDYLAREKTFDRILIRPPQFWKDKQITMTLGTEVIAIDPAAKSVTLSGGRKIGYTDKTGIGEAGYDGWTTMAPVGAASPYSRTSFLWNTSQSPFKPELVFEAGNRALSPCGAEAVAGLDSLSLLTASRLVAQRPLDAFWATSAATAQAARMAAQLTAAYPQYWPETIRALMVHSARWTGHMDQLVAQCATKREKADCLRRFGYGIPDLGRAMASAIDDLALVAQNTIRPFRLEGGSVRFNESHIYQLPWPQDVLEQLDNTRVRLNVTLSYFVEPNPSFATNLDPARYQSFGLRFDLKRSRETIGNFNRRNNAEGYDKDAPRAVNETNDGWLFGEKQISSGSLHVDIWEGPAVELAARNALYVHPISGWWRERKSLGRYDEEARYALVISLETPGLEVDLHTPISALVPVLVEVPIEI